MVDILSTRLQEVYAKWEARAEVSRNPESNTARFSISGKMIIKKKIDVRLERRCESYVCILDLRRTGQQLYRRKIQDREQTRKIRENSLFKIKETEPLAPFVKEKSSLLHYCCNSCTPSSRVSFRIT